MVMGKDGSGLSLDLSPGEMDGQPRQAASTFGRTHYRSLMRLPDPERCAFYGRPVAPGHWRSCELARPINRVGFSRRAGDLELGTDCRFVAHQCWPTIDGKDDSVDLVFSHRKLGPARRPMRRSRGDTYPL